MKHLNSYLIIGFLLTIIFPVTASAAGKHALLIGIQEYHHPDFKSLRGPENDLHITEQVLRKRLSFEDEDFIILKNEQATHTGIQNAFEQLIDRVQENDFVYIYYSGHGSQTKDLNGDELDKMDETWVSYGTIRSTEDKSIDNYDVLDDEVDAYLAALHDTTQNVVFVSDSCHSATVSRGQAAVNRAVDEDERDHPLGKMAYVRPPENFGIRVGAARDPESAIEIPFDIAAAKKEAYHGLFTYFWVQSLEQAKEGAAWNDVFKRAFTHVTAGRGHVQQPRLWGARGLHIDGRIFTPLQPTVPITDVDDAEVTLGAGKLSGVTVGSVYRSDDASNPAKLTITAVKAFKSVGKAEGTFKKSDLVIEETHAYHFAPIKVHVAADFSEQENAPLLKMLRKALQPPADIEEPDFPGYALAGQSEQADLHLFIVRPKQENGRDIPDPKDDVLPKSFADQPPEVWILTPEHRLLHKNLQIQFDDSDLTQGKRVLKNNLDKYARIRALKTLTSPGVAPAVRIDVTRLSPAACEGEPDDCVLLPEGRGWHRKGVSFGFQDLGRDTGILPFNERFTFTLRNESEKDYYCYLLDIMPDGTISATFPNPKLPQEDALIKAGKSRDLTLKSSIITNMLGAETLKFIVTRHSFDVSLLESKGFQERGGDKGAYNPLEQLLVNELYEQRGTDHYQTDEWATEQVSFEVKE